MRRSTVWGAVCIWLLPVPALAQYVIPAPVLPQAEKDPTDPDATYCRPPQPQTDSRLLGPRVCMTNRQWDGLHKQGLDMSADGKSTVSSEKYRTLRNGPCHSQQDNCF